MRNHHPNPESRLVYSTDAGRIEVVDEQEIVGDGNVRVRPEKKGRGGKVVTVISGLPLAGSDLRAFANLLKKRCGGGGTVKDGNIEIHGDHVDVVVAHLKKEGYDAKRAGG